MRLLSQLLTGWSKGRSSDSEWPSGCKVAFLRSVVCFMFLHEISLSLSLETREYFIFTYATFE